MTNGRDNEQREALARWLFERNYREAGLCSPEDADWDEWVERNREEWREEADALLTFLGTRRQPIEILGDALRYWSCCGAPNLCGVECQENELSHTLAAAERLVRPEAEKARESRLLAAELNRAAAEAAR